MVSSVVQLVLGTFSLERCLQTVTLTVSWLQMLLSVAAFVLTTPVVCFLPSFLKNGQQHLKGKELRLCHVLSFQTVDQKPPLKTLSNYKFYLNVCQGHIKVAKKNS